MNIQNNGEFFLKINMVIPETTSHARGAFHSSKYSGLKFRVFHATNGTVGAFHYAN